MEFSQLSSNYGTHDGAKSPGGESPGHHRCHVGRTHARFQARRPRDPCRGRAPNDRVRARGERYVDSFGVGTRRGARVRRDRCSGRSPRLGNPRSLAASGIHDTPVPRRGRVEGGGDGPDGRGQAPAGSKRVEHRRERERPETRRRSLRVGLFGGSVEGWGRYLRRRVEIEEKFAAGGAAVVARAGAETDSEPPTALPRSRRRRYRRGDRRTARGVHAHERTGAPPARSEAPKDQSRARRRGIHRRGRPQGDRRTRPGHPPGRNQARRGHRDPRGRRIRE